MCVRYLLLYNKLPKKLQFKTTFTFSRFWWIRNPYLTWVLLTADLSWGYSQMLAGAEGSPEGLTGRDPLPCSLTWLLAEFNSLWAVGPRASVSHCLVPGGLPQLLAIWSFTGQFTIWQLASLWESRAEHPRWKPLSFCKSRIIAFAIFYFFEVSHLVQPTFRGGITQGHKYPESGITGGNLRVYIPLYAC